MVRQHGSAGAADLLFSMGTVNRGMRLRMLLSSCILYSAQHACVVQTMIFDHVNTITKSYCLLMHTGCIHDYLTAPKSHEP